MERRIGLYKRELQLNSEIPALIDQILDPTLQEPLQKTISEDRLFQSSLFEYRNRIWILSRVNMFKLTQESELATSINNTSTFTWLVTTVTASEAESSSYSSNYQSRKTPYYNQLDVLAWLCLARTYHDLKEANSDRKKLLLVSVLQLTMERIGLNHPLGSHFIIRK